MGPNSFRLLLFVCFCLFFFQNKKKSAKMSGRSVVGPSNKRSERQKSAATAIVPCAGVASSRIPKRTKQKINKNWKRWNYFDAFSLIWILLFYRRRRNGNRPTAAFAATTSFWLIIWSFIKKKISFKCVSSFNLTWLKWTSFNLIHEQLPFD